MCKINPRLKTVGYLRRVDRCASKGVLIVVTSDVNLDVRFDVNLDAIEIGLQLQLGKSWLSLGHWLIVTLIFSAGHYSAPVFLLRQSQKFVWL